jgi:hypothetical protein
MFVVSQKTAIDWFILMHMNLTFTCQRIHVQELHYFKLIKGCSTHYEEDNVQKLHIGGPLKHVQQNIIYIG